MKKRQDMKKKNRNEE